MNFKTTILLLIVLAAVGAAFYLMRDADPIGTGPEEGARPAVINHQSFEAERIQRLTLERDGQTVVIERAGGGWKQVEPFEYELTAWRPDAVAAALAHLDYTEKFIPGQDGHPTLSDLQLDPPQASITATTQGGEDEAATYTLLLGRKAIGGRAYAKLADAPEVYVIDDLLHTNVEEDVRSWRVRAVRTPLEGAAEAITLKRRNQPDIALQKQDGRWRFTGEHVGRASTATVSQLLQQVSSAAISEFVIDQPQNLRDYQLANPTAVLAIKTRQDGQTTTLLVGGQAGFEKKQHYAALLNAAGKVDTVFIVPDAALVKLQEPVEALRDPRISVLRASDVNRLSITRTDGDDMTLVAKARGWAFDTERGFAPDSKLAERLVQRIVTAEAVGYRPAGSVQAEQPLATITLGVISQREPETLRVLAREEGAADRGPVYLVVRNDEQIAYEVPAEQLEGIFAPAETIREAVVWSIDPEQIRSIQVGRADGTRFVLTPATTADDRTEAAPKAQPTWSLQVGDDREGEFDHDAAAALVRAVATLKAEAWRPGVDSPIGGVQVTIELADETTRQATFWPADRLALGDEIPIPFVIAESVAQAVDAELRSKTLITLGVDQIAAVRIASPQSPDNVVTVKRDATGAFTGPEGFDRKAAAQLWDALSGLQAQRFVPVDDQAQPMRALTIVTTEGNEQTLTLFAGREDAPPTAQLTGAGNGTRRIMLSDDDLAALSAPITNQ